MKETIFDKFFNHRDYLIIQYKQGDLTKKEYIQANVDYIYKNNIKPFDKIDIYEKGMYNYQYYNMMAKYYFMQGKILNENKDDEKYVKSFIEEGHYYYRMKDKSTLNLLKLLKFKNMEAYFIKLNSKNLMGKLYEICLKDYDKAILHSQNYKILEILKKERVFSGDYKKSVIDEYVNVKY
ncbi:hypothetical protein PV797_15170 [Clostridiaceae bacterium M8S5]|nr:hypothetical protein PV797_15170 [Clostridiaceae bacterium M8S5]